MNRAASHRQSSKLWQPKKHDVVCSEHFPGGNRVDEENNAVSPSIFPTHSISTKKSEREKRIKKRTEKRIEENREKLSCSNSSFSQREHPGSETENWFEAEPERKMSVSLKADMSEASEFVVQTSNLLEESRMSMSPERETTERAMSTSPKSSSEVLELFPNFPSMLDYAVQTSVSLYVLDPTEQTYGYVDKVSGTEKATQISLPPILTEKKKSKQNRSVFSQTSNDVLPFSSFNDRQMIAFCGVDEKVIKFLLLLMGDTLKPTRKLSRESKLLLVLIKLKLGLPYAALGAFFNVCESGASACFNETLPLLFSVAKEGIVWFDREMIKARMPKAFKSYFPNTRAIIDCSEIQCQRAPKVRQRVLSYSSYKSRFTVKFLVAIAPSGEITFVSPTYGGRATDTEITVNSGFLDLLEEGDIVMADKGFPTIERDVNRSGGILVIPPFKSGKLQFTEAQNRTGYEIAAVRVHVERAIERLKRFEMLNFVTIQNMRHIDQILVIVCFLNNLFPDLTKE